MGVVPLAEGVPLIRDDVAEDVAPQPAQPARFAAASAGGGGDAVGEAAEGEGLEDDVAPAGEGGVEETLTAEESVLYARRRCILACSSMPELM
jgi:hypothetical protein